MELRINFQVYAAANFAQIGMSRHRFEQILRCISFSFCPEYQDNMNSAVQRWALVDDFVMAINHHRQSSFTRSESICIDESMSRWYGIGGSYTNKGLPNYVHLDRKPKSGAVSLATSCVWAI